MSESKALKDYINRAAVTRLGEQIKTAQPKFPLKLFVATASRGLSGLEFTARTQHVARSLRTHLPADVRSAFGIIRDCLPPPLTQAEGMFSTNFWLWPLSDFVRDFGAGHWSETMATCHVLTQCFTAEFAIRPQLQRAPERTLARLREWTSSPSAHVRRLCSEGPRPRLPWAGRLLLPREPVAEILEALRADHSRFVQKSVANHLNDLGKDDPDWLLGTMLCWQQSTDDATQWIVRHALRTQIKGGNLRALAILGYAPVELGDVQLCLDRIAVNVGQRLSAELSFSNREQCEEHLLLDWVMHYVRPNGLPYRKVFKGRALELAAGQTMVVKKTFDMTVRATRALYPGTHRIAAQVNGNVIAGADFELSAR